MAKMQMLIDRADSNITKLAEERKKFFLCPFAINWSDQEQRIFVLTLKEQREVRQWWAWAETLGYRRPSDSYDVLHAMERVEAALDAGVAACVEELVQNVENACLRRSVVPSPPRVRRTRARARMQ